MSRTNACSRAGGRADFKWKTLSAGPLMRGRYTRKTCLMNPLDLEWGTATPALVTDDSSTAIHVINHAFTDEAQLTRNLRFVRGRVAFFARQLPSGMKQHIIFDVRGQDIPVDIRDAFRRSLASIASFQYTTERA